jgi:hypothetical protein
MLPFPTAEASASRLGRAATRPLKILPTLPQGRSPCPAPSSERAGPRPQPAGPPLSVGDGFKFAREARPAPHRGRARRSPPRRPPAVPRRPPRRPPAALLVAPPRGRIPRATAPQHGPLSRCLRIPHCLNCCCFWGSSGVRASPRPRGGGGPHSAAAGARR